MNDIGPAARRLEQGCRYIDGEIPGRRQQARLMVVALWQPTDSQAIAHLALCLHRPRICEVGRLLEGDERDPMLARQEAQIGEDL